MIPVGAAVDSFVTRAPPFQEFCNRIGRKADSAMLAIEPPFLGVLKTLDFRGHGESGAAMPVPFSAAFEIAAIRAIVFDNRTRDLGNLAEREERDENSADPAHGARRHHSSQCR